MNPQPSPLDLKDAFEKLSSIPIEKLKSQFSEPIKKLSALNQKLQSEDPKVRQEALKLAAQLKDELKNQIKKLYEEAGLDLSQLASSLKKEIYGNNQ